LFFRYCIENREPHVVESGSELRNPPLGRHNCERACRLLTTLSRNDLFLKGSLGHAREATLLQFACRAPEDLLIEHVGRALKELDFATIGSGSSFLLSEHDQ